MELRRVAGATEARRLWEKAALRGVERAAWARARGVDPRSLNAWRVNLGRGRAEATGSGLRLVEVTPEPPLASSARYTAVVGDVRVAVGRVRALGMEPSDPHFADPAAS